MFTKENGKKFVTVLAAALVALAIHQKFIAPALSPKAKPVALKA
jgi:hypothetical protein